MPEEDALRVGHAKEAAVRSAHALAFPIGLVWIVLSLGISVLTHSRAAFFASLVLVGVMVAASHYLQNNMETWHRLNGQGYLYD